jgi:hypothetical protein
MSLNASPVRSVLTLPAVSAAAILTLLLAPPLEAACPAGDSNPVTSGDPAAGPIVVLGGLGPMPVGSFFLAGSGAANNSGTLPSSLWLERIGDLDGDGVPEIRVGAPGDGPGGWGDPRTQGCPSSASPPHPPLVLVVRQDNEDLDGDGKFDVWEDSSGPPCQRAPDGTIISTGADLDCDGRFTQPAHNGVGGGCEGFLREDIDCDGRLDKISEDLDGDGRLDQGEDRDNDGHLDTINEDRNNNNLLDDRTDASFRNHFFPDENGNFGNFYPYMAARPAKGNFVIVAVAWDGQAYDLQSSNLPTTTTLEDLDHDGAFDVFEDFLFRNGVLDPGEDLDGDGRLTPPGGCEGTTREDEDCDGRLDRVDEDLNHNGRLDPGEDLDGDGRLDDGTEDRNHDELLNDRPFPSPDDVIFEYRPPRSPLPLGPNYPYRSFTPAGEVRVLAAHPVPTVPPAGCPAAGGPGRPLVDIGSIGTLQSGSLDARVSISDPDLDLLSGRVGIEALLRLPDPATGGSDLCAGPLLPEGERGRGALFVGSAGLPPMLLDLDSLTGCDDGQPDFGFTYGACGSSPGEPPQSVLTLSCTAPYPICIHRLDGEGDFDYIVHQVDAESALLSGASPSLPSQAYAGSKVPRSLDLRALPAPGDYALTITADDGVTPVATDSMLFGWNGEKTLYINHPGHRAGRVSALRPEPVPMPAPTPVPAD